MRFFQFVIALIFFVVTLSSCNNRYDVVEVVEVEVDNTITTFDELKLEIENTNAPFVTIFEEFITNGTSRFEVQIPTTGNFDILDNTILLVDFGVFYNGDNLIRFDRIDVSDGSTEFDLYFK